MQEQNLFLEWLVFFSDKCLCMIFIWSEKQENKKKQRFLLGESMGGAVVLLLHKKQPSYWNGAVLVAPMCKVINQASILFNLISQKFVWEIGLLVNYIL